MSEIISRQNDYSLRRSGVGYIVARMILFLLFAVILFVAAGTLSWIRGWIYFICILSAEVCTLIIIARKSPEMLNQRGTTHPDVKTFDNFFNFSWMILSAVTPLVAGFDVVRFEWSSMPFSTLYVGAVFMAVSFVIGSWAMIENVHFEGIVRIQTDRNHRVVTTGPYRIIRHPGYVGYILLAIGTPFILGSWWSFVTLGPMILMFVIRTAFEDKILLRELKGYEEYARRTRFRLFPGIW